MKTTTKSKSTVNPRREAPPLAEQLAAAQALAAAMPYNTGKAHEFGRENAVAPPRGASMSSSSPTTSASALNECNASSMTGAPERARSDTSGQAMTTNQGLAISDNQNSLKAGLRGPTLVEDFILREKITHFDHERIPERIVHARGLAGQGYFEAYQPLTDFMRLRFPVIRRFTSAPRLCLVRDKLPRRNMRRELITDEELNAKIRHEGVEDVTTVKRMYLEADGEMSLICKDEPKSTA